MARKSEFDSDVFDLSGLPSHPFTSKQVVKILKMKAWRLQKFLNSPEYKLSASGQAGQGIGSRRLFSYLDIFRLGIAAHLVADGFGYRHVAAAVSDTKIEDSDIILIHEGEELPSPPLIIVGSEGSLSVHRVKLGDTIAEVTKRYGCRSFYFLDVQKILEPISHRMTAMTTKPKTKRGK